MKIRFIVYYTSLEKNIWQLLRRKFQLCCLYELGLERIFPINFENMFVIKKWIKFRKYVCQDQSCKMCKHIDNDGICTMQHVLVILCRERYISYLTYTLFFRYAHSSTYAESLSVPLHTAAFSFARLAETALDAFRNEFDHNKPRARFANDSIMYEQPSELRGLINAVMISS